MGPWTNSWILSNCSMCIGSMGLVYLPIFIIKKQLNVGKYPWIHGSYGMGHWWFGFWNQPSFSTSELPNLEPRLPKKTWHDWVDGERLQDESPDRFLFLKDLINMVLGHFFTTNPYVKHDVTKTMFTLSAVATGSNIFLRENGVLDALFAGVLDRGFCRWWFQTCSFFTTQIEEMIHFDEHICSVGFGPNQVFVFFFRTASDEFWLQHLPTKPLMNACEDWSRHGNPKNPHWGHRNLTDFCWWYRNLTGSNQLR